MITHINATGEALGIAAGEPQDRLWVPGDRLLLDNEAARVSQADLLRAFAEHVMPSNDEQLQPVPIDDESLSAMLRPRKMPTGVLFVDIDDLLGDLSGSLQALQYSEPVPTHMRYNNHDYGEGWRKDGERMRSPFAEDYAKLFFDDSDTPFKYALISMLKNSEAGMQPARHIEEIRATLMRLRAAGVYVTFVTASTPGSELATVGNFLGRYLQGAADGVVITDGHYTIADKGRAATSVLDFIEQNCGEKLPEGIPVAAFDDWPSHTAKIRNAVQAHPAQPDVLTMQYLFPSSQPQDPKSLQITSQLLGFWHLHHFFAERIDAREQTT